MGKREIMALIDFQSDKNAINLIYTAKQYLQVQKINVGAEKIDSFSLKTYNMIITTI